MLQRWRRTGNLPSFFVPPWGIWQLKSPHPREFVIQGKKNANARGSAQGGWAQLELTDALHFFYPRRKKITMYESVLISYTDNSIQFFILHYIRYLHRLYTGRRKPSSWQLTKIVYSVQSSKSFLVGQRHVQIIRSSKERKQNLK